MTETSGSVMTDFLYEMWVYQYPKCVFVMFVAWLCYLKTKTEVIVDFCWVLNHWIIGLSLVVQYIKIQNYRGWIELVILTFWFCRLGGFLFFNRVIKGHKDKRYDDIAENSSKKNLFFFIQYQFQAILVVFTGSTLYWVFRDYEPSESTTPRWNFIVGGVLSIFGIVMEWISDNQLENYKSEKIAAKLQQKVIEEQKKKDEENGILEDKINQNRVNGSGLNKTEMNSDLQTKGEYNSLLNPKEKDEFPNMFHSGLWKKSRHPNLFYELVCWLGFVISGLNDYNVSFMGFLGPVVLWAIMFFLTIPLTEKTMKASRPNWDDWCCKSNKLLPFF